MKTIRLTLMLCAFFMLSLSTMAQSSQATITKSGAILLNDDEPLKESYTLDASQFNFDTTQEALDYFKEVKTDLVFYRPALQNGIVTIYLQLRKEPNWSIEDWNNYLASNKVRETEVIQERAN